MRANVLLVPLAVSLIGEYVHLIIRDLWLADRRKPRCWRDLFTE